MQTGALLKEKEVISMIPTWLLIGGTIFLILVACFMAVKLGTRNDQG